MDAEFIKYRDFFEKETANDLIALLRENNVEYKIEEYRDSIAFTNRQNLLGNVTTVKIKQEDFPRVDELIAAQAKVQLADVASDHYLYSFTNEELLDVLGKPDEWSAIDYQLSKNILITRGIRVDDEMLNKLKNERLKALAQPEIAQTWWVWFGYAIAIVGVLIGPFFGGMIGIFIGWHLTTYKKVLPNGERIYGYRPQDRVHGRLILTIASIMFIVATYLRLRAL